MLAAGLVLALATLAASAQTNEKAKPDEPATAPVAGPNSGTAPGGAGSTGWSGGTGGSNIGTSPHAPSPGSPTEQPPTATGLDPIKGEQRKN
jgi:hypothetical protein